MLESLLLVAGMAGGPDAGSSAVTGHGGQFTKAAAIESEAAAPPPGPRDYVLFEAGPVRPVALSPRGERLYVTNVPDGRLEIFAVTAAGLVHAASVPVGIEPVAVALTRDEQQAWVVNHLSDSISIVDLSVDIPRVIRTLWVGDEPRDIVFAGPDFDLAFVTTAHRGQSSPVEPRLTTHGIGRADVWVFDRNDPGSSPGGEPLQILTLFGDTPRALAASLDGDRVFAAIFRSGNRTTTLPPSAARPFPKALPTDSADGVEQPNTGLIVKHNGRNWVDETGATWDHRVAFELPDFDVFEIDALADPPREVGRVSGVGTTLFNLAVNPANGHVYVTNTDARNHVRFEGRAERADTTVRGHLADNRIAIIADGSVRHRRLNPHLDFSKITGSRADRDRSLSTPMQMALSADGATLYVAAFGSGKVARYATAELEAGDVSPDVSTHVELSGGGPAGLALDAASETLYVYTRFDNAISVVDTPTLTETAHIPLHNPEPDHIVAGRPFLYDARRTSGFGNDSCATCHLFGNVDALAWDLGDPDATVVPIPNAYHPLTANHPGLNFVFHPMKGPMTTQSMRGLPRHGPMHWRGDRTGADRGPDETLEAAAFKAFNVAFDGLLARGGLLTDAEMQRFTDFAMELTYPPNPLRPLDNSLTEQQAFGRQLYNEGVIRSNGAREVCVTCHPVDPAAGTFGTEGLMAFNNQPGETDFKIPHFRDQYQKIGSFSPSFSNPVVRGPQVRGFGFNHNGATHTSNILDDLGLPAQQLNGLRAYLFAFPTESAPIVGQQVTVEAASDPAAMERVDLLVQRARVTDPVPECDLVVHGVVGGVEQGWLLDDAGLFIPDDGGPGVDREALLERVVEDQGHMTFTCTPWGSGRRIALDRDGDGVLNRVETRQGSSPDDAADKSFNPLAGLWFDAGNPGHGIDFQRVGGQLVATWFTYEASGAPTWYQAVGPLAADGGGDLLRFTWNGTGKPVSGERVGDLGWTFGDKANVAVDWSIGEAGGTIAMERFVFDEQLTIRPYGGLWFDPDEPGWGLSIDALGETRVAVVFFYDADGAPRWVLGQSGNRPVAEMRFNAFTGPCPACEPRSPESGDGGHATFSFGSLRNATVELNVGTSADDRWLREVAIRPLSDPPNLP